MRVILTEKYDQARALARYLVKKRGVTERFDGAAKIIGDDVVIPADGHLYEDYKPEDYDACLTIKDTTREVLPIIPKPWKRKRRVDPSARASFKALEDYLPRAASVLHACDADPEGQLAGDEIFRHFNLTVPIDRLPIVGYDNRSLDTAFASIVPNDTQRALSAAALARSRADWLWGFNLSRLYMIALRETGEWKPVSAGRVVSPTLYLLAEREKKIRAHTSLTHYTIKAHLLVDGHDIIATWQPPDPQATGFDAEGRLVRHELANEVVARVEKARTGCLSAVEVTDAIHPPPLPFSLSSLQNACGKLYRYTPDQVADAAQKLYAAHSLISFVRGNCRYWPSAVHPLAHALLGVIAKNVPALAEAVVKADALASSRAFDNSKLGTGIASHHAILPLEADADPQLGIVERDVYEMIARNFVAQFYPPARIIRRTFTFTIAGDNLVASTSAVAEEGWRPVLGKNDRGSGAVYDTLLAQAPISVIKAGAIPTTTKPPGHLHDYDLIEALNDVARLVEDAELREALGEDARLGTESTQTETLQTLLEKKFVIRDDQQLLHVTPFGLAVAEALPVELKGPGLTTKWERQLLEIAQGKGNASAFFASQRELVSDVVTRPMTVKVPKKPWRPMSASRRQGA